MRVKEKEKKRLEENMEGKRRGRQYYNFPNVSTLSSKIAESKTDWKAPAYIFHWPNHILIKSKF